MQAPEPMDRIDSENLGRRAYEVLKAMIIDGELSPGEHLVQERLAVRLGISRTPLLAALSRLEQERLVETRPRRGAFVRIFSRGELLSIYDIRCRLEPLGARGAAQSAGPEGMAAIERLLAAFQAAAAGNDPKVLKRADYEFHMEVMRRSGNAFLYEMLEAFHIIRIANTKGMLKPAVQSAREHAALVEALRAADPDGAERLMFEHLSRAGAVLPGGDESTDNAGR